MIRAMLVRSSPCECTCVTLPPWYQSQTIAAAFPTATTASAEPTSAACGASARRGSAAGRGAADARVVSIAGQCRGRS